MSSIIEVELRGLERIDGLGKDLLGAVDVDTIAEEATAIVLNRIRTRFLDQVSPDGAPWEQSQAARDRASSGRGGGTLYDSGRLFRSIHAEVRGVGARAIFTDVPYAPFHNNGQGQVKREFMGVSSGDVEVIRLLTIKRLKEAI